MKIDELLREPGVEASKSFYRVDSGDPFDLEFGTLLKGEYSYPAGRCKREVNFSLDEVSSELDKLISALSAPSSIMVKKTCRISEHGFGLFFGIEFSVPNKILVLDNKVRLPPEMFYLFSAHLQTGLAHNIQNFLRFKHKDKTGKMPFLPILITPATIRYSVSDKRVCELPEQLEMFKYVLRRLQAIDSLCPGILAERMKEMYAWVRVTEIKKVLSPTYRVNCKIQPKKQSHSVSVEEVSSLQKLRAIFGDVYQYYKGPQEAIRFDRSYRPEPKLDLE